MADMTIQEARAHMTHIAKGVLFEGNEGKVYIADDKPMTPDEAQNELMLHACQALKPKIVAHLEADEFDAAACELLLVGQFHAVMADDLIVGDIANATAHYAMMQIPSVIEGTHMLRMPFAAAFGKHACNGDKLSDAVVIAMAQYTDWGDSFTYTMPKGMKRRGSAQAS